MMSVCCFVVCLLLAEMTASRKLPGYVQVCKVTDPAYDACVLKSVEALRPRLAKGIPKMRIPALEPFWLPALEINRYLEGLSARLTMKDVRAFDASRFQIERFKSDLVGLSMTITVVLPTLAVEGEYDIEGKLLTATLGGKGNFGGNFTNIRSEVTVWGKVDSVDGVRRLSVTNLKAKTRLLGEIAFKLFNRPEQPFNAALTQTVNEFLKQNRQQVLTIIYPIIDETLEEILIQTGNSILKILDFDELYPS